MSLWCLVSAANSGAFPSADTEPACLQAVFMQKKRVCLNEQTDATIQKRDLGDMKDLVLQGDRFTVFASRLFMHIFVLLSAAFFFLYNFVGLFLHVFKLRIYFASVLCCTNGCWRWLIINILIDDEVICYRVKVILLCFALLVPNYLCTTTLTQWWANNHWNDRRNSTWQ